jgi:putative endonuclease
MEKGGYIDVMTNKNKSTLYIGVTNDLKRRILEHRIHYDKNSFTSKYNLEQCIYYEYFSDIQQAIAREKQLKNWNRKKKEILIQNMNPQWKDLFEDE